MACLPSSEELLNKYWAPLEGSGRGSGPGGKEELLGFSLTTGMGASSLPLFSLALPPCPSFLLLSFWFSRTESVSIVHSIFKLFILLHYPPKGRDFIWGQLDQSTMCF